MICRQFTLRGLLGLVAFVAFLLALFVLWRDFARPYYHVATLECGSGRYIEISQESEFDTGNYLLFTVIRDGTTVVDNRLLAHVRESGFSKASFRVIVIGDGDLIALLWNPPQSNLYDVPRQGESWGRHALTHAMILLYRFSTNEWSSTAHDDIKPSLLAQFLDRDDAVIHNLIRESADAVQDLFILGSKTQDQDFQNVSELRELRRLGVMPCRISDQSVRYFGSLKNLKELFLSGCDITDAAVPVLKTLTSLRLLSLENTSLSHQAIADLRAALPMTRVEADGN